MIDGATDIFDKCVGHVFNSLTYEQPSKKVEERWVPIDRPQIRGMSLYQCEAKQEMGVYSTNSVDAQSLEIAYRRIEENIPHCGKQIAASLLEPFQNNQTGDIKDSLLNADVINYFVSTLQSSKVATMSSHLYGAIDKLPTSKRAQLLEANLILWPVSVGEHWYLMLIEKFENNLFTINVLDSNNNKKRHSTIAAEGKKLLEKTYGGGCYRILNDAYPSHLIPLQDNAMDDGTAIAYYAFKRVQCESLSQYGQYANRFCHYVQFRMHMALEIAQAAVVAMFEMVPSSPVVTPHYTAYASKTRAATSKERDVPKRGKIIKVI